MSYLGKSANFISPYFYTNTGDGVTTAYALTWTGGSSHTLIVFVGGVWQTPGVDFTLTGSTLTFTTAPGSTLSIVVYGMAMSGLVSSVAVGSVTSDKLESLNLKAIAGLTLAADQMLYVNTSGTISLTSLTAYGRSLLGAATSADLVTALGIVDLTSNQTITGVKTFSTRPIVPKKPITYLSESGFNSVFMIYDGKLYSTSASTASNTNYTTGRGTTGTNPFYGTDNFKLVPIPSSSSIVKVGLLGAGAAYALLADGSLYTWGSNSVGACGVGNTSVVPVPTLSATGVVDVYSSPSNNQYDVSNVKLAIKKTDGYIYIAGYNTNSNLGVGDTTNRNAWTQITSLGTNVSKFFNLGSQNGCWFAQKSDDTIWAAGCNVHGELGTGGTTNVATPVNVTTAWQGGTDWVIEYVDGGFGYYDTAAAANSNVVMLLRNRTTQATKVLTCGFGGNSTLGNGATANISTPYLIPNSSAVQDVSYHGSGAGTIHMLLTNGTLYGWGFNAQGQVGNGTATDLATPAIVQTNVSAIVNKMGTFNVYGYRTSTWIKKTDGYIYATGYNADGQLAIGSTTATTSFTKTLLPLNVAEVVVWSSNTGATLMARTTDHTLYAWGYNAQNNITTSTTIAAYVPTTVSLPE